jgi:hypothetical protein
VDDYVLPPCKAAVRDFVRARGLSVTIEPIDWAGAYWRVPPKTILRRSPASRMANAIRTAARHWRSVRARLDGASQP